MLLHVAPRCDDHPVTSTDPDALHASDDAREDRGRILYRLAAAGDNDDEGRNE
jgi:hypothetical protein